MAAVPRLVVIGGFLGAGKTTTLLRLAEHWAALGQRVAIVANDQAPGLVDTALFAARFPTMEVAGGCFCCRLGELEQRLQALTESTFPDVILAEPVGSCTDLVATVLRPLAARAGGARLAPYTALVDPHQLLAATGHGSRRPPLSEKIAYLFRMQQLEAAAIAINKIDTLSNDERQLAESELTRLCPRATRLALSARTGEGVPALAAWLDQDWQPDAPVPLVDYRTYGAAEAELAWLNATAAVESATTLDVALAAPRLASILTAALGTRSVQPEHAKLRLASGEAVAHANVIGVELASPTAAAASPAGAATATLIVNVRASTEPSSLHAAWMEALETWADELDLVVTASEGECFRPAAPVPSARLLTAEDGVSESSELTGWR